MSTTAPIANDATTAAATEGVAAYITHCNDSSGGFSTNLSTESYFKTGMGYAAEILDAHKSGQPYMKDRTFHIHSVRAPRSTLTVKTGLGIFDKAAARSSPFMTGNVSSNVQTSQFIRPYTQTECNGHTFAPGQLRIADLEAFTRGGCGWRNAVPKSVLQKLGERTGETTILYRVFHITSGDVMNVHGWVLTQPDGKLILSVEKDDGGLGPRSGHSRTIMEHARDVFTMAHLPGSKKPLLLIDKGVVTHVDPEVVALAAHLDSVVAEDREEQEAARHGERGG